MNFPHRRAPNADTLDEHISAAIELNEARAQKTSFAEVPLLDGNVLIHHFAEPIAGGFLIRTARRDSFPSLPLPPVFITGLAIESAFTGHRHIFLFESINQ